MTLTQEGNGNCTVIVRTAGILQPTVLLWCEGMGFSKICPQEGLLCSSQPEAVSSLLMGKSCSAAHEENTAYQTRDQSFEKMAYFGEWEHSPPRYVANLLVL